MKRVALEAKCCSLHADGTRVFLDDYDSKEEALDALHQYVLENVVYEVIETIVED